MKTKIQKLEDRINNVQDLLDMLNQELAELKDDEKEPEQPKPEAGDVWADEKWTFILGERHSMVIEDFYGDGIGAGGFETEGVTRLGTFKEVFARRDKVVPLVDEILRMRDEYGDALNYCNSVENGWSLTEVRVNQLVQLLNSIKEA